MVLFILINSRDILLKCLFRHGLKFVMLWIVRDIT